MTTTLLTLENVSKTFVLHNQNSVELRVLDNANLTISSGEGVVLEGPSGMGKSTLLKLIYANYRVSSGRIIFTPRNESAIDITQANPRELVNLRRHCIGYVSQFLRVIPRVSALDVVAEPLMEDARGDSVKLTQARDSARELLTKLRIPERLWHLPPATFSGGEQQRINIARGVIKRRPLMLFDEPTASLDPANTQTVIDLIKQARADGSAVIGIFHDVQIGNEIATRHINVEEFRRMA